jgi:hypothetical protein
MISAFGQLGKQDGQFSQLLHLIKIPMFNDLYHHSCRLSSMTANIVANINPIIKPIKQLMVLKFSHSWVSLDIME